MFLPHISPITLIENKISITLERASLMEWLRHQASNLETCLRHESSWVTLGLSLSLSPTMVAMVKHWKNLAQKSAGTSSTRSQKTTSKAYRKNTSHTTCLHCISLVWNLLIHISWQFLTEALPLLYIFNITVDRLQKLRISQSFPPRGSFYGSWWSTWSPFHTPFMYFSLMNHFMRSIGNPQFMTLMKPAIIVASCNGQGTHTVTLLNETNLHTAIVKWSIGCLRCRGHGRTRAYLGPCCRTSPAHTWPVLLLSHPKEHDIPFPNQQSSCRS